MHVSYRPLTVAVRLIALCLLHVSAALAGNMSFISDAPIGQFTDEDLKLMNDNIDAALADTKVRIVHSWTNPRTKHSGTAESLQVLSGPNAVPCKRMWITNRAGSLKGQGQYTLCKIDGKEWTLVPKDYVSPSQSDAAK